MTQEEIKKKLQELRNEREKINKESEEIFAKTKPIQQEIDRLEMLAMGFDYEAFGKEPKCIRFVNDEEVEGEKTIYLGYITSIQRRTHSISFKGKIVQYQEYEYENGEHYLSIIDDDEIRITKDSIAKLEIISKEEFDLQSHLFAAKVLKTNDGNVDFVHEYMITKEKAFEAFNKVLGGFIDSSFDMSKPWEEIFKSYLEE